RRARRLPPLPAGPLPLALWALPFALLVQTLGDLFGVARVVQLEHAAEHLATRGLREGVAEALFRLVEAVPQFQVRPAVGGGDSMVHLHVQFPQAAEVF